MCSKEQTKGLESKLKYKTKAETQAYQHNTVLLVFGHVWIESDCIDNSITYSITLKIIS